MRVIAAKHLNGEGLKPAAQTLLAWIKDFDLCVSANGKYYIDPRTRHILKDNHLKMLLRRDVTATDKVIDAFIVAVKVAVASMAPDEKLSYLFVDMDVIEKALKEKNHPEKDFEVVK